MQYQMWYLYRLGPVWQSQRVLGSRNTRELWLWCGCAGVNTPCRPANTRTPRGSGSLMAMIPIVYSPPEIKSKRRKTLSDTTSRGFHLISYILALITVLSGALLVTSVIISLIYALPGPSSHPRPLHCVSKQWHCTKLGPLGDVTCIHSRPSIAKLKFSRAGIHQRRIIGWSIIGFLVWDKNNNQENNDLPLWGLTSLAPRSSRWVSP